MRHRSPARWLAPLALVTCAVAAYAIVQGGGSSGDDGDGGAKTVTATHKVKTSTSARKAAKGPSTYTVKSGDVLSAIAEAHGTTVDELLAINPSLDAANLHVGEKIRLSR